MSQRESFFIGELADRTGLGRDAIRYYESVGVLPKAARNDGGYRLYGPEDVDRITFIGQAQTLGLTLEEITEILEIVDAGEEPCVHVRTRLEGRLEETRERIRDLRRLEGRLETTLSRASSEQSDSACRCRMIEAGAAEG